MTSPTQYARLNPIYTGPLDFSLLSDAERNAIRAQLGATSGVSYPTREVFVAAQLVGVDGVIIRVDDLLYQFVTGAGDIPDLLNWVPAGEITIGHFGAAVDLALDARPALQLALAYAKSQVPTDLIPTPAGQDRAVYITVNLQGRVWTVKNTVSMDLCRGVVLANGGLAADPASWPAPVAVGGDYFATTYASVLQWGGANDNLNRSMGLVDLVIECNGVADGVLQKNLTDSFALNVHVHGQVHYGHRVTGPRTSGVNVRRLTAARYYMGETGSATFSNRQSIGIASDAGGTTFNNCDSLLCGIGFRTTGVGPHTFHDCVSDESSANGGASATISAVANNGSGACRLTVNSTTGFTTGALVSVPVLTGIASQKAGVYICTVINGTTMDIASMPFAGAYTASPFKVLSLWSQEAKCVQIEATTTFCAWRGTVVGGKVQVEHGAEASLDLTSDRAFVNAVSTLELVSNGVSGANFAGISGRLITSAATVRLVPINSGTISADPLCAIQLYRQSGSQTNRIGTAVTFGGSVALPGLSFNGMKTDDTQGYGLASAPTTGWHQGPNGEWRFGFSGAAVLDLSSGGILPVVTNTKDLGSASLSWRAVYGELFSGGGVQATNALYDSTADKLMRVGAFGLGGAVGIVTDFNALTVGQTVRSNGSGTTGNPSANAGWFVDSRNGGNVGYQIGFRNGAVPVYRNMSGGVWGATWDSFVVASTALFQKFYQSAQQTITLGGTLTLAHGLGAVPSLPRCKLVCVTAEANYSVNDVINVGFSGVGMSGGSVNLIVIFSNTAVTGLNKTTGAGFTLTPANWRLVAEAWL